MSKTSRDALSFLISLMAQGIAPFIRRVLSKLVEAIADAPRIDTNWVVHFTEPSDCSQIRRMAIDVTLRQKGRFVRGEGHVHGEPSDPFCYYGTLKRNVFYGTFRRKDSHILAGTGTFVLKVNADSKEMCGYSSWFDSRIDNVWSSDYWWERKG